jgi:hypothetical protein
VNKNNLAEQLNGPIAGMVALAVGLAVGCAPSTRAVGAGAPEIGLSRGGRWSVLAVAPPNLSGPNFTLCLRKHVLTGWVSGESAPAGALRVRIDEDSADGFGPLGPVAIDFTSTEVSSSIEGTWNGARVHFDIDGGALRGTVADNAVFPSRQSPLATPERRHALRLPMRRGDGVEDLTAPVAKDSSCQYLLDERDSDGAFVGTSICAGMPQPTRLAIPGAAVSWLTRPELLTVLTAVLSVPPVPPSETRWPAGESDFDDGSDWR